jgi:hypothetical protein
MRALTPLLALPLLAAGPRQDPSWQPWTPDDSSFSVLLPSAPSVSQFHSLTSRGTLPTRSVTARTDPRTEFLVAWTEYPNDRVEPRPNAETFAKARDAVIERDDGGEILAETAETVPGQTGHRTTFQRPDGRIVQVRFIMHRHRFYQIQAETEDTPAARASGRRFLDSFVASGVVRI